MLQNGTRSLPSRAAPDALTQAPLMKKLTALTGTMLLASCASYRNEPVAFGAEMQAYPAGVIPGLQVRRRLNDADAVFVRVAANLTERNDWGEHDDESGSGFGGGVGWRRALGGSLDEDGWIIGARVDLWSLEVDWKDPGPRSGSTDVLVLQPTLEGGHGWTRAGGDRIEATLGLGAEINVDTDGEDVGEGAIVLLGITWLF